MSARNGGGEYMRNQYLKRRDEFVSMNPEAQKFHHMMIHFGCSESTLRRMEKETGRYCMRPEPAHFDRKGSHPVPVQVPKGWRKKEWIEYRTWAKYRSLRMLSAERLAEVDAVRAEQNAELVGA